MSRRLHYSNLCNLCKAPRSQQKSQNTIQHALHQLRGLKHRHRRGADAGDQNIIQTRILPRLLKEIMPVIGLLVMISVLSALLGVNGIVVTSMPSLVGCGGATHFPQPFPMVFGFVSMVPQSDQGSKRLCAHVGTTRQRPGASGSAVAT